MRHILLTTAALGTVFTAISTPALADAETEALKAQVKALTARIEELERREKQREKVPAVAALAPSAVPANPKVEQRLAIVERNQEIAQEEAKAKAEKTPAVEVGSKGFAITSPDKQYAVRVRAYAQADTRTFFDNSNTSNVDTFLIRTARPILEAKMTDYFSGRLMLDFGNGTTRLLDAYGDFKPMPSSNLFALRTGKFKVPLGIERWQSEQDIMFVERGMTTNLVPFRDIGVMAYGELISDQLEYHVALGNGVADLGESNGDADDTKDVTGRLFAHPFRWASMPALQGLGLGVAGSYGHHEGSASSPGLAAGYTTPAQARFFAYQTGTFADGVKWRFNPQAYYYNGPLGIMGEYVLNSQEVQRTTNHATLRNTAWTVMSGYVLTGEDASFDGVKPANNFDPAKGQWGAFEVLARYGILNVDNKAFPNFATASASARQAREATVGGTWYFNPSVKLNLDYSWTTFEGGATAGDREDEKALMSRVQFRF